MGTMAQSDLLPGRFSRTMGFCGHSQEHAGIAFDVLCHLSGCEARGQTQLSGMFYDLGLQFDPRIHLESGGDSHRSAGPFVRFDLSGHRRGLHISGHPKMPVSRPLLKPNGVQKIIEYDANRELNR